MNRNASTDGYKVRLSAQGSRCLYRDGRLIATNLRTSACVDYAKKRDVAYREALAWHRAMPKTSPGEAWRRLRGFLEQYELRKGHHYPIMRRVLGRKRDLKDGRQLSLDLLGAFAFGLMIREVIDTTAAHAPKKRPKLVLLPGGKA